jgi:hypothetical protein
MTESCSLAKRGSPMARLRTFFTVLLVATAATASPVFVPAGKAIHFKLLRTISTASARAGEEVPAELTSALLVSGRTVAKDGAPAVVRVNSVESSGRVGGNAKLTFSLVSVTLANGHEVAIHSSSYSREGRSHVKHNATYIAGGAIVGALAGQAIGGDSKSTQKGAAIGAGLGIGGAAATGKFDFEEPAGSRFSLTLRKAIRASM